MEIPTATLDLMRTIGDPVLKERLDQRLGPKSDWCLDYLKVAATYGLTAPVQDAWTSQAKQLQIPRRRRNAIQEAWKVTVALGAQVPTSSAPVGDLIETRQQFWVFGEEIGAALLLAALPEAYAAKWGSQVLAATGVLNSNPTRRIRATAQFLIQVLAPKHDRPSYADDLEAAWKPDGAAFQHAMGLRLFHHSARQTLLNHYATNPTEKPPWPKGEQPLNQEDLLGTRLTFTVSVFETLEKFGVRWSQEQQLAFLRTWNYIGKFLGICDKETMRHARVQATKGLRDTPDVATARCLLQQLRDRQWTPVGQYRAVAGRPRPAPLDWDSLQAGRTLVRALLDVMAGSMPMSSSGWPIAVMRQLVPLVVLNRLGLGANGFFLSAVNSLPDRHVPIARFTGVCLPNPVNAFVLRMMANEVTRRSVVAFLEGDGPPFVIPGLEAWSQGIGARAKLGGA
jgi:hypothetical protein